MHTPLGRRARPALPLAALLLAALVAGPLTLVGCDAADPSAFTADVPLASAAAKIDLCHYDADADAYHPITVALTAASAHFAHGDWKPGDEVPTMPGYDFDAACVPVLRPPPLSAQLHQLSPITATYEAFAATGSGLGDVTGAVTPVDINLGGDRSNTSGCEAADFAGFPAGSIALIQRGACTFAVKALNAEAAGATAVVFFNQGTPGNTDLFGGSLQVTVVGIPVVTASFDTGVALSHPGSTAQVLVVEL